MSDINAAISSIGVGKVIGALLIVGLFIAGVKALGGSDGDKKKSNNKSDSDT